MQTPQSCAGVVWKQMCLSAPCQCEHPRGELWTFLCLCPSLLDLTNPLIYNLQSLSCFMAARNQTVEHRKSVMGW